MGLLSLSQSVGQGSEVGAGQPSAFLAGLCLSLHLPPSLPDPLSAGEMRTDGFSLCSNYGLNPRRVTQEKKIGEVGSKKAGDSEVKALSNPLHEISSGSYFPWALGELKGTVCHQPGSGQGLVTSSVLLQVSLFQVSHL